MMISIEEIKSEYDIEMALIILCIRCHFKTSNVNEIRQYIQSNPIDWAKFSSYSVYHKVQPIVYQTILICAEKSADLDLIKNKLQQNTLRNWQLAQETERVVQLFQKANIEAIPYKGTAYSQQFYGNLVSRVTSDIDLLIDWENLRPCIDLLKNEGYIPENEMELLYGWDKLKKEENEYNMDLYQNGQRRFHVELHWSIGNTEIDYSDQATRLLSSQAEKQSLIRDKLVSLTDESHFLAVLFHHAGKDVFSFLRNLIDLAQAAPKLKENQWAKIQTDIEKVGLLHAYEMASYLIEQIIGVQIPKLTKVNNSTKTYTSFLQTLLSPDKWQNKMSQIGRIYHFMKMRILLLDTKSRSLNLVFRHVNMLIKPSIKDYLFLPLTKRFHFIYLVIKPVRMIKETLSND
ncbi:nucleotidyltransferase family protein [Aquirufa ecclesiirivi]|uniref:Nucleotidyltransferase family protein n=1 Tax=Aquirufa ecclesiirivi TaxID=2715124 RepID=A0ABT4JI06_9BACT|nr:nucleotidyltransferase family protein [Aquirufa ecclesiirivi]MCZ2475893.1 nucleotidyltransferase family protein [Aquirufa ecclesiirivi]